MTHNHIEDVRILCGQVVLFGREARQDNLSVGWLEGNIGVMVSRRGPLWWRCFTAWGAVHVARLPGWRSRFGVSVTDIELLGIASLLAPEQGERKRPCK